MPHFFSSPMLVFICTVSSVFSRARQTISLGNYAVACHCRIISYFICWLFLLVCHLRKSFFTVVWIFWLLFFAWEVQQFTAENKLMFKLMPFVWWGPSSYTPTNTLANGSLSLCSYCIVLTKILWIPICLEYCFCHRFSDLLLEIYHLVMIQ